MVSNGQKSLIKRAQRQAGLDDFEYREALLLLTGCTSSTDPGLGDRSVDTILAYFEAIYWRKVDKSELQPHCRPNAIFRQRGYWATKNTRFETSRDRFTHNHLAEEIRTLEGELAALGFGSSYCQAIKIKVLRGATPDNTNLWKYKAALERTLRSKQKQLVAEPF